MFTVKHRTSHLAFALITTTLALYLPVAHAVLFSSDISITGQTSFDNPYSFGGTGDFSLVSGGATTTSTFIANPAVIGAELVTGSDPIIGSLTDINDGSGFSGNANTSNTLDDYIAIGLDSSLTLNNISLNNKYEVVFKLSYSNMVNADGSDAWSTSELSVAANAVEIFNSYLISDSLFGDADNSGDTGTFGDVLIESGDEFFSFVLNPLDILALDMSWSMEGENLAFGLADVGGYSAFAETDLSAFLSIYSVEQIEDPVPVPLPGTLFLVGIGIILLPLQRRMRAFMRG